MAADWPPAPCIFEHAQGLPRPLLLPTQELIDRANQLQAALATSRAQLTGAGTGGAANASGAADAWAASPPPPPPPAPHLQQHQQQQQRQKRRKVTAGAQGRRRPNLLHELLGVAPPGSGLARGAPLPASQAPCLAPCLTPAPVLSRSGSPTSSGRTYSGSSDGAASACSAGGRASDAGGYVEDVLLREVVSRLRRPSAGPHAVAAHPRQPQNRHTAAPPPRPPAAQPALARQRPPPAAAAAAAVAPVARQHVTAPASCSLRVLVHSLSLEEQSCCGAGGADIFCRVRTPGGGTADIDCGGGGNSSWSQLPGGSCELQASTGPPACMAVVEVWRRAVPAEAAEQGAAQSMLLGVAAVPLVAVEQDGGGRGSGSGGGGGSSSRAGSGCAAAGSTDGKLLADGSFEVRDVLRARGIGSVRLTVVMSLGAGADDRDAHSESDAPQLQRALPPPADLRRNAIQALLHSAAAVGRAGEATAHVPAAAGGAPATGTQPGVPAAARDSGAAESPMAAPAAAADPTLLPADQHPQATLQLHVQEAAGLPAAPPGGSGKRLLEFSAKPDSLVYHFCAACDCPDIARLASPRLEHGAWAAGRTLRGVCQLCLRPSTGFVLSRRHRLLQGGPAGRQRQPALTAGGHAAGQRRRLRHKHLDTRLDIPLRVRRRLCHDDRCSGACLDSRLLELVFRNFVPFIRCFLQRVQRLQFLRCSLEAPAAGRPRSALFFQNLLDTLFRPPSKCCCCCEHRCGRSRASRTGRRSHRCSCWAPRR